MNPDKDPCIFRLHMHDLKNILNLLYTLVYNLVDVQYSFAHMNKQAVGVFHDILKMVRKERVCKD
jgi:hypothetical protein